MGQLRAAFLITKWPSLEQLFGLQSGAKGLQSGAGITKWGKDYKVGQGFKVVQYRLSAKAFYEAIL